MRAAIKGCLTVLVAFSPIGVVHAGESASIDQSWIAKIRMEAPAVYEKYEALSRRLEEESEYRSNKIPGSTGTIPFRAQTRRDRVVHLGDAMLVEQMRVFEDDPNKSQIRLQCDNENYNFTLDKSQDGAPYFLVDYAPGKRKIPLVRQQPGLHNNAFADLRDALAAVNDNEKHTLQHLKFDDAKKLLLIEYTISAENALIQKKGYFDPNHDWHVIEHRTETPNAITKEQWTYGITVGGLEFPTELKNLVEYKAAKAPPNLEISRRVFHLKITDKTPDDFFLSAFGLPEPVDVAPRRKPTPWYLWILLAALAAAALGILFSWLKRRQAGKVLHSPKIS